MTLDETDPGEVEMQPRRAARRLWVLTAALLVASTALGLWSASPAAQNLSMGCYGSNGCQAPPLYVLYQLAYTLVPSGMLAGLLTLGLALLVTNARPTFRPQPFEGMAADDDRHTLIRGASREAAAAHPDAVWDGRSHDPFRRPEPDARP